MTRSALILVALFMGITMLLSEASAFRGAKTRVEIIPRGGELVVGRSGIAPFTVESRAPEAFLKRQGGTEWTQRLSGPTGGFRRIWGEGIPVDPSAVQNGELALAAARTFWQENADMLPAGVTPDDLTLLANVVHRGIRFVSHGQTLDGISVLGTGNFIAIKEGRIVLFGVRSFPVTSVPRVPYSWQPFVTSTSAREIAAELLGQLGIAARPKGSGQLALLPLASYDKVSFELVHQVELSGGRAGSWTAYVDAQRGKVLALRDNRIFWDGAVTLRHHDRHPASEVVIGPARHLEIETDVEDTVTDSEGAFTVSTDPSTLSATLKGTYVSVVNHAGPRLELSLGLDGGLPDGGKIQWDGDGGEADQAQLDAYSFTQRVREHAEAITGGDNAWTNQMVVVNVNQEVDMNGDGAPDYCNAWFDGQSINFLKAGKMGAAYDCNNTAMVSDIIYHEYGHAVHMHAIIPGVGAFDGAAGEGFADTMASSITGDYLIGPYFTKNGGAVRELESDLVWPYDQAVDPHHTGLIVGGALWDLRQALIEEYGVDDGNALLDEFFTTAMRTTTDVPSVYEAVLLADDDNGNLADGTPNFCTIYDQFDLHGLASKTLGRIDVSHEQIADAVIPEEPIAIDADVLVGENDCFSLGSVRLAYSTDDGENWTTASMTNTSGDAYRTELPGMPEGAEILYRLEAEETVSGDVIKRPDNEAEPFYKIYIGPLEEILCDDFETETPGWTHELIAGEPREGADDWQRRTPGGRGGDPSEAYSGDNAWGNDLTPEEIWDGKYQEDKINALSSPKWDLSEYQTVRLRFRRWLTIEDGALDRATIFVNEQEVWSNWSTPASNPFPSTHHIDKEWILFDLDITAQAARQSEVQVRFELSSDAQNHYGGWTIDDFCLYTTEDKIENPPEDAGPDTDTDADAGADTDTDTSETDGAGSDASADGGNEVDSSDCGCRTTGKDMRPSLLNIILAHF